MNQAALIEVLRKYDAVLRAAVPAIGTLSAVFGSSTQGSADDAG